MDNQNRLSKLFGALNFEASAATAGSSQGQFPILDLLGNLRDEAADRPGLIALQTTCAAAWERLIGMVESAQPFQTGDIEWLKELLVKIQALLHPAAPADGLPLPGLTISLPADSNPPPTAHVTLSEESPLNLNLADDGALLREFITESREHLDHIEQGVLVLENHPADAETLNTVFRAFHTFKGGAGFLNLIPINRLAHVLESLLDLARQGQLTMDARVIELILRGRDVLKQFLDEIEGQVNGTLPTAPIVVATAMLKLEVQAMIDRPGSNVAVPIPAAATPVAPTAEPILFPPSNVAETAKISAIESPAAESAAPKGKISELGAVVKVDTGKLDGLLDLVSEMVIAQSLVTQNLNQLANPNPQFARNMVQLGRLTKELQRVSMSLRMVPIRGVFQKMARVTRDISAKVNKPVQFLTSGEDTELDRGVVEELNDPLLHMIRNSVDHGIETPAERVAAGKPPAGRLELRAFHQGGNIVVELEDDGAGLNRECILNKAIERGLTAAGNPHTDDEVFNFIFAAGFSMAKKITDLSGRGVGLDVVRRNIERLRGHVAISSTPGRGTRFKITLPLTLAIIDGLIVKVGDERYIIPTLSVREAFRLRPEMIARVQNRAEMINVRNRLIPLLRLQEFFAIQSAVPDATDGIVIVVQSGPNLRCLLVDGLLHKQEVVIKNLNDMMVHKNRSLAGAAILGDGQVGLILDVNALVHLENQPLATAA